VARGSDGALRGVEAVIDKDLASALLATALRADLLLISTAVPQVAIGWGRSDQRWLGQVSAEVLRGHMTAGEFAAGSMLPKITAALRFLEGGGGRAIITDPPNLVASLRSGVGTQVVPA
jgi:carbamate kinase